MAFFTKKPVTIEALQYPTDPFDNAGAISVYEWVRRNSLGKNSAYIDPMSGDLMIHTLEGDMRVSAGDWVIRGVQGEFYPCKPDIFKTTYEEVSV